jgi:BirA family biotin operon repressor/biotin-[acetyl-CoA-carboxylase] ligase
MTVDHLLEALADGEFHSGEALARDQGVSRTAIWKQMAGLTALGLEVERRRGLGYRIPGGVDRLREDAIRQALHPSAEDLLHELRVYSDIASTNEVLLASAPAAPGRARVALAERQNSGRGRRGKQWISPFGRNIYLSLDWQFDSGVQAMEGLSLAVGVAVVEALADCGVDGLRLKWPNDVLHGSSKLGGILVELAGDAEGPCRAVVGIGINVAMPQDAAAEIDQAWTDLEQVGVGQLPGRNVLAAAVIGRCLPLLAEYTGSGFRAWRERWLERDAYAGQAVTVSFGASASASAGVARGVDERGALLLETPSGLQPVSGGEVSLRRAS